MFDSLLAKPTQKIPKYLKEIKPDQRTKTEQAIDPSKAKSEPKQLPESTLAEKPSVLAEAIPVQTEDPLT